jgi:hypothetical protein
MPPGRIFSLAAALLLCSPAHSMADRKKADPSEIPAPPPLAIPLQVEVFKGEAVSIPLIARGRAAGDASFLVRTRPRLGQLGPVQSVRPGSASVEYQHGDGPAPAEDEFTFAVQSPGSPVSAPARVRISIRLRPAELLPPKAVEFGEVLLGRMGESFFTLTNVGGEALETKFIADEGWIFPEGNEVIVRGGEAQRVPVIFRPTEEREYSGVLRFSHDEKLIVPLSGTGVQPLRWNPLTLAIHQDAKPGETPDFLELENRTREELRGRIEGGEGITIANQFAIPSGGTLRIPVQAADGFLAGAEGALHITHQHGFAEIPYRVFPAPARVRFHPEGGVDFGEIPARQSAERALVFENSGGLPASVSLTPPPGIEAGASMDFQLPPGEKTELPLVFQSRKAGPWSGTLKVRVGREEFSLPVRANVTEAADADRNVFISPASREGISTNEDQPQSAPDIEEVEEVPLLGWQDLRVVSQTPTTVVLEWETDVTEDRRIEIEQRSVGIGADGNVELEWKASPHADVYRSGGRSVRATIFALEPGMRLNLRHAVRDDSGELRGVSEMLVVETPVEPPGFRIPWGWLLALVLVAFLIWHARKRRQAERDAADAEIRRLEENR